MYRFFADFYNLTVRLTVETWHELIVGVLNMIDIVLTANLVLIVVSSGYENFIHKIEGRPDLPEGLTAIDFGVLKQRVLGSIAVIASVDALAWYLDLERSSRQRQAHLGHRVPARCSPPPCCYLRLPTGLHAPTANKADACIQAAGFRRLIIHSFQRYRRKIAVRNAGAEGIFATPPFRR